MCPAKLLHGQSAQRTRQCPDPYGAYGGWDCSSVLPPRRLGHFCLEVTSRQFDVAVVGLEIDVEDSKYLSEAYSALSSSAATVSGLLREPSVPTRPTSVEGDT